MSNSNYDNTTGQDNYRNRSSYERSGGRREGGGFRIRLSDNEMKAVRSIQETFQLRSTVAVLGFSVRTLSEMIKDENLIEAITKYAESNKNSSPTRKGPSAEEKSSRSIPDPFARPIKSSINEQIQIDKSEKDEN